MTGRAPAPLQPRATVVVINQDRVLLVKREGETRWALPGGRIAEAETPIERAAQSVTRATGLRITSLQFLGRYEGRVSDNQVFLAETEGELQPNLQYIQDAIWWGGQEELPLQDHVNAILDRMLGEPEEVQSPEVIAPGVEPVEDCEEANLLPSKEGDVSHRLGHIAGIVGLALVTGLKALLLALHVGRICLVYATDALISAALATQGTRPRPVKRQSYSQDLRRRLHRSQGGRCIYCGRKITLVMSHVDHVLPLNRGGPNTAGNAQLTCPGCNMRKGDRTDGEFRYRYSSLIPSTSGDMPGRTVRQSEFKRATARTSDTSSYRGFKGGKYYTPAQKINIGALIAGVGVGGLVFWLFYEAFSPEGPDNLVIACAILGGVTWGWAWLRAWYTGRHHEVEE